MHYNIPELQSAPGRNTHPHIHSAHQANGQHCPSGPRRDGAPLGMRPELSAEEDSEEGEEEDEEEEEAPVPRWQGIEAVFEAYQAHAEGELGFMRVLLFIYIFYKYCYMNTTAIKFGFQTL